MLPKLAISRVELFKLVIFMPSDSDGSNTQINGIPSLDPHSYCEFIHDLLNSQSYSPMELIVHP